MPGAFVVSLDFELHWGVRDHKSVDDYRENLLGSREVIPRMLELFASYGIHATWATVGFLFCENRNELLASVPACRPAYDDTRLSPYSSLHEIGEDERSDPFHYAPSLIELVRRGPGQLVERRREACGVTAHLVDTGIDTGNILGQAMIDPTPQDNFVTYRYLQLAAGHPLLKQAVRSVIDGQLAPVPAPEGESKLWSHPTITEYLRYRVSRGVK